MSGGPRRSPDEIETPGAETPKREPPASEAPPERMPPRDRELPRSEPPGPNRPIDDPRHQPGVALARH